MHLIPIVALFILLLTCSFTQLFEQTYFSNALIKKNQEFNTDIHQKSREILKKAFVDIKGDYEENIKKEHSSNQYKSKINLYPLIKEKTTDQETLYHLVASLIRKTYGHASFYKKDLEYRILDNFIKLAQEEVSKKSDLQKLEFSDKDLHWAWYRMMKGCKTYDIADKEGYPPLGQLVTFSKDSRTKIFYLPRASLDLLGLIFTPAIAKKIHEVQSIKRTEEEKKRDRTDEDKFEPINEEKLKKILQEEKFPMPDNSFFKLVSFTKDDSKKNKNDAEE